MKHAGYRSHKNYFYKAAQVHRETLGQDIPTDLHLLMQKILRSIKRGQGPTPFKDAFELELFHVPLQRRLDITRSGDWFNDRFAARDITLIACWWMLRGIEAAAARFQHIWFHETNITRFVYFTLPVQKNDPTGLCVTRGHPCTCKTGEPNPMPFPCHATTHEENQPPFPKHPSRTSSADSNWHRRLCHQGPHHEDLFLSYRTYRYAPYQTRAQRWTFTSLRWTRMPCLWSPVPVTDGIFLGGYTTDWPVGFRCS